jgi:hypothetical protein
MAWRMASKRHSKRDGKRLVQRTSMGSLRRPTRASNERLMFGQPCIRGYSTYKGRFLTMKNAYKRLLDWMFER